MLLGLAGLGLTDARPIPTQGWSERLSAVRSHGLTGLLALAYDVQLVELDDEAHEQVRHQLDAEAVRGVQLEGELIRLEPVIDHLGAVIVKGAVLAHGAYQNPALRPFTDIDMLVTGTRHEEAIVTLEVFGYQRSRPEPIRGYDATVAKALTLVHPSGVVIDLHRTLVAGLAGVSIDVDAILAERRTVTVNDRPVAAPSWETHLIEVCLHAVIGDGLSRALSIRDIAEVLRHPELRPDRAAALAWQWDVAPTVATGIRAAAEAFRIEIPADLAQLAAEAGGDGVALVAATRSERARLAELKGGRLRRRITVARSLVTPSREFLRFTYGERLTPALYVARWRSLYRRTRTARTPTTQPAGPPRLPGIHPSAASVGKRQLQVPDSADAPRNLPQVTPSLVSIARPVTSDSSTHRYRRPALTIRSRPSNGTARTLALADRSAPQHQTPPSRQRQWAGACPPRASTPTDVDGPNASRVLTSSPPPQTALPDPKPYPPGAASVHSSARSATASETGTSRFAAGVTALVVTVLAARFGLGAAGLVLVPVAGLFFAQAASCRIARRRPEEAWVGQWLVYGVLVKLAASYVRYFTLVNTYGGAGDASDYNTYGREFAQAWMGHGAEPYLTDLRKTNFLRWFTGVVYYVFGSNMVAGFFIFGLLALVGTYFWYRATADAVPFLDKKLYLGMLLFAPSIAFWPSSIGKESLMQLGIGATTLATSFFLRQRIVSGLLVGIPGGWLLWVVRPHLLAMVTIAAAFAYLIGRVRSSKQKRAVGTRTIGLLILAFILAFSLGQTMKFLGMKDLSLNSIDETLSHQQAQSSEGGSSFDNGGDYLSPVNLPRGFATVLLRPFPWETGSPLGLTASLETAALAVLIIVRFSSIRASLSRARGTPFLLYCWVLMVLYAATFSSFANFGLLVRQRSLILPAVFVLIAIRPGRAGDATQPTGRLGTEQARSTTA